MNKVYDRNRHNTRTILSKNSSLFDWAYLGPLWQVICNNFVFFSDAHSLHLSRGNLFSSFSLRVRGSNDVAGCTQLRIMTRLCRVSVLILTRFSLLRHLLHRSMVCSCRRGVFLECWLPAIFLFLRRVVRTSKVVHMGDLWSTWTKESVFAHSFYVSFPFSGFSILLSALKF